MFPLSLLAPAVAGLLIAFGARHVRRRSVTAAFVPAPRWRAAICVGIALTVLVAVNLWSLSPAGQPTLDRDGDLVLKVAGFCLPLVVCVGALLVLVGQVHASPAGPAELLPRTLVSFASRRWLAALGVAALSAVVIAVIAGTASSPDEAGRYVSLVLEGAGSGDVAVMIYGWWFSVPCLALITVIIAIVLIELVLVSRPPLSVDRQTDIENRQARVRDVLAVSCGGLLLHLAVVFRSLFDASTVMLTFDAGASGTVELGSSFAVLGPVLVTTSYAVAVLGFTLWWTVFLSALPARTPQLQTSAPV